MFFARLTTMIAMFLTEFSGFSCKIIGSLSFTMFSPIPVIHDLLNNQGAAGVSAEPQRWQELMPERLAKRPKLHGLHCTAPVLADGGRWVDWGGLLFENCCDIEKRQEITLQIFKD